ncbi:hypothetical protein IH879_10445 [candidate division KSB1 bacterium]|nr:hypothetical protein [candidate division KSB1 bacterium]
MAALIAGFAVAFPVNYILVGRVFDISIKWRA